MKQIRNLYRVITPPERPIERRPLTYQLHLDFTLLVGLCLLAAVGLVILYSAAGGNQHLVSGQFIRLAVAFFIMLIFAQVSPKQWRRWAPIIYSAGLLLLIAVMLMGVVGKGAQRWLHLGFLRFQPSEIMKLAIPMMLAFYLNERPLPVKFKDFLFCSLLILVPVIITAKQPDLGTALMLALSGACVLFLAGMSWKLITFLTLCVTSGVPILWHYMHQYQRQRVLTFISPERDPLGHGYHIIQSKIAIGSGGIFGKGWLNGTQSHLDFLPEHATDFIFAVTGEEFGLLGSFGLLLLYLFIIGRGIYIASQAQDTFCRLLALILRISFFFSMFVNVGMVIGVLPVVGLPLPLVSYGGTSMVTILAGMGLLMSIQTHRTLLAK